LEKWHLVILDTLLSELLGRTDLDEGTVAVLHEHWFAHSLGLIQPADEQFVRHLHGSLFGETTEAAAVDSTSAEADLFGSLAPPDPPDPEAPTAEDWKARAYSAMKRAKEAEKELAVVIQNTVVVDFKFKEVKRRFAKRYHPNNVAASGMEAAIRAEVFKEFWAEFEAVEHWVPTK
jgi:hypothetical protein